jgi:hypothetical protein
MLNLNLNIVGAGQRSNIGAGPDVGPTTTTTTTTTSTTTTSTTTSTTTTAGPISVRTDPYSASLQLALPFSFFPSLGMTEYNEDISQIIRGTGTGYGVQSTQVIGVNSFVTASNTNPTPKWVSNNYSSSIKVSGNAYGLVNPSASIAYNNLNSSSFTIESWVNSTGWNSINGAVEIYRAYSGGPLLFTMQSTPASGSNPQLETILIRNDGSEFIYVANPYLLQTGSWYHTAVVRDGNDYNMLLNGEVIMDFQNSAILRNNQSPKMLGSEWDTTPVVPLTASFQDFRIYKGVAKYPFQPSGSTYTTPLSMIL